MNKCTFGTGFAEQECRLVAGPSGLCPRHQFLEEQLGPVKALIAEYGVKCAECGNHFDEEMVATCETCDTENVCHGCRSDRACCEEVASAAEEEACNLENEAEELQSEANQARRRAERIREATERRRSA